MEILPNDQSRMVASNQSAGNNRTNQVNQTNSQAVLRLEVELRDKNARRRQQNHNKGYVFNKNRAAAVGSPIAAGIPMQLAPSHTKNFNNYFVPMETVSSPGFTHLQESHSTG